MYLWQSAMTLIWLPSVNGGLAQVLGTEMGTAIADYLHIFNPSMVIIGGGVSQSGEIYFGPLRTAMNEHVMSKKYLENLTLTASALGDEVGLMGALALAQDLSPTTP
jgi:glucokinase